ncbi:metal ABC transporter solute-binding protein, Zn/Mn family [Terrilactibacillus laevilacticus]|uniref:Metal ABC transporter solute-binding protein, Zn/Mn family n=1 Tax=Terrilactibacillus laevilacticus TaxID=1380157 RepID=A0ABW5PV31_9BACI|nr:zinc ABC transporter substrate-binding protein [Terrilactibacillus laevilacticus]
MAGKDKIRKFIGIFLILGSLLLLTACGSQTKQSNHASGKVNIVVAEDFYGEVAKAVGGKHVKVTSIINSPNVDPHEFDPTAQTTIMVSKADLIIYNGIGYDNWVEKLVDSTNENVPTIRVGEDVMKKQEGDNEHLWYNPETMPKLANYLAGRLAKIDSKNADTYDHNAKAYSQSLQPVTDLVKELKQPKTKSVDVSEPLFDNMLTALNYKVKNSKFALAVEEGSDPAPKDLAAMQDEIKGKKIDFFVNNKQVENPILKSLLKLVGEKNIPIVNVTETLPKGKTYKTWMLDALRQIEQIQDQSESK